MSERSLKDLSDRLAQNPSLYVICTEEVFLQQQARTMILNHLKAQLPERISWEVNANFDWAQLARHRDQPSLFASHDLIELYNVNNRFPRAAGAALKEWVEKSAPQSTLILYCSKFTAAQQKTAWYQACDQRACVLRLWPIKRQQMPQWLQQQARQYQLTLTQGACQLLAAATEGHLLAADQVLMKLKWCALTNPIDEKTLRPFLSQSGVFNAFDWVDAALDGHTNRVKKIYQLLIQSKQEPLLLLGALNRTLRDGLTLAHCKTHHPDALAQTLQRHWPSRRQKLQSALQRLSLLEWEQLLARSQQIDCALKGMHDLTGLPATKQLLMLSLSLAGQPLSPVLSS